MARDSAVRFFYSHAGYSWNSAAGETKNAGRWRCARELAKAEAHAARMGWEAKWEADPWHAHEDSECANVEHLTCLLVARGEVVASLSSVCGADINGYARVVAAELALEAMHTISSEVMEAI